MGLRVLDSASSCSWVAVADLPLAGLPPLTVGCVSVGCCARGHVPSRAALAHRVPKSCMCAFVCWVTDDQVPVPQLGHSAGAHVCDARGARSPSSGSSWTVTNVQEEKRLSSGSDRTAGEALRVQAEPRPPSTALLGLGRGLRSCLWEHLEGRDREAWSRRAPAPIPVEVQGGEGRQNTQPTGHSQAVGGPGVPLHPQRRELHVWVGRHRVSISP